MRWGWDNEKAEKKEILFRLKRLRDGLSYVHAFLYSIKVNMKAAGGQQVHHHINLQKKVFVSCDNCWDYFLRLVYQTDRENRKIKQIPPYQRVFISFEQTDF